MRLWELREQIFSRQQVRVVRVYSNSRQRLRPFQQKEHGELRRDKVILLAMVVKLIRNDDDRQAQTRDTLKELARAPTRAGNKTLDRCRRKRQAQGLRKSVKLPGRFRQPSTRATLTSLNDAQFSPFLPGTAAG